MKKINIILQARQNSKRLPDKILLPIINNKPVIFLIVERLKKINNVNEIILSTSKSLINKELINYAKSLNIKTFSDNISHEDDLCSRIHNTCLKFNSDAIVKVNGDCPIPEINIINKMVKIFYEIKDLDYISNKKHKWPLGYSAEIISMKTINWCNKNLTSKKDRELFASRVGNLKDKFKLFFLKNKVSFNNSEHFLLDSKKDLNLIKKIYSKLYQKKKFFNFRDINNLLRQEHNDKK